MSIIISTTAKLVETKSEQKLTLCYKNRYCCDTDCPMWKCTKVCSHIVVYQDKCLQDFLSKIIEAPNFYALAKSGMPSNTGKKADKCKTFTKVFS